MTTATEHDVVVRSAGEGPATWAMGSLFERLAAGTETGGALGISLVTQPPGVATPLHVHSNEAEAFFILDGELRYRAGETVHHLTAGSFIYLPQGLPHAFRIVGATPAKILAIVTPGALLALYDEVGIPAAERRLPGQDGTPMEEEIRRWNEVGPRYGLSVVGPPIPE
jgi:quercetin dioxygenase-like cupin family protein